MKKCGICLALLAVVVLVGGLAACNKVRALKGPYEDTGAVNISFVDHVVDKFDNRLSLTAEQKGELKRIVTELLTEGRKMHDGKHATLEKLVVEVRKPKMNTRVVDEMYNTKKKMVDSIYGMAKRDFLKFHAMLTPIQRVRLAQAIQEHHSEGGCWNHKW